MAWGDILPGEVYFKCKNVLPSDISCQMNWVLHRCSLENAKTDRRQTAGGGWGGHLPLWVSQTSEVGSAALGRTNASQVEGAAVWQSTSASADDYENSSSNLQQSLGQRDSSWVELGTTSFFFFFERHTSFVQSESTCIGDIIYLQPLISFANTRNTFLSKVFLASGACAWGGGVSFKSWLLSSSRSGSVYAAV